MGPRLLRNFTRDRGNQITLGVFLGTFSYALMVLRSVRTQSRGRVRSASLAERRHPAGLRLRRHARLFRRPHGGPDQRGHGHRTGGRRGARSAVARLTTEAPGNAPPVDAAWHDAVPVSRCTARLPAAARRRRDWPTGRTATAPRSACWCGRATTCFPARPSRWFAPLSKARTRRSGDATALGRAGSARQDLEFAVRQLVEVAVRALSPGINDPNTAIERARPPGRRAVRPRAAATCRRGSRGGTAARSVHARVDYDGLGRRDVPHDPAERRQASAAVLIRLHRGADRGGERGARACSAADAASPCGPGARRCRARRCRRPVIWRTCGGGTRRLWRCARRGCHLLCARTAGRPDVLLRRDGDAAHFGGPVRLA